MMTKERRRKRIKAKKKSDSSGDDVSDQAISSFYDESDAYLRMRLIDDFLRRLPRNRRKPFLKLLDRWVEGDPEVFLRRVREDEMFLVESIGRLVERLKAERLAPKTITGFYIYFLKRFLRFCGIKLDWDLVKVRVDLPKRKPIKIDKAPSIQEVRKMILGAKPRLGLLIHLLATTGLRSGEALSLKVENLDLEAKPPYLMVITEKSNQIREVFLTRELTEALKNYLNGRESGYIFTTRDGRPLDKRNFLRDFMNLTIKLGINRRDPSGRGWMIHPHSLRKFYKTRLEEAGVNFLVIETWMGHDIGVSGAYFRPSRKMLLEEWRKAEKALTLFSDEEDRLYEDRKIEELEKEIEDIKRTLTYVLDHLKSFHNRRAA